jgi:predicted NBD/HSP70 family sugar kinase
LGEAFHYPAGHNVLGVTIGSGIGCGFASRQGFGGSRGYAMELGHITSIIDGATCNCGRYGCLEAYSSLNGMRNRLCEWAMLPRTGISSSSCKQQNLTKRSKLFGKGIELFSLALANLMIIWSRIIR